MKAWKTVLVSLLGSVFLIGCAVFDSPDATGVVTSAEGEGILVEFDAEVPDVGGEALVGLPPNAPEVRVGDQVSLWLVDGVAESLPPQISASRVEVDG